MVTKGFAQYELLRAPSIEDTIGDSESNIYVDMTWNTVDKILETPPLTSTATLVSQEGKSKQTCFRNLCHELCKGEKISLTPDICAYYSLYKQHNVLII